MTKTAKTALEDNEFTQHLELHMRDGGKTAKAVVRVFTALALPMPDCRNDFSEATEGALVFSSTYGVVIRIEHAALHPQSATRINDNPWILQPLATFRAGKAVVEVCPGVDTTKDHDDLIAVDCGLRRTGVNFWDAGNGFDGKYNTGNVGILPFKTPEFPKGIPVMIDRLAATQLTKSVKGIKDALAEMGVKADPQKALYAALRKELRAAYGDAAAMKKFWKLCEKQTQKGLLIAGWDHLENDDGWKQEAAADTAFHFDAKVKALKNKR